MKVRTPERELTKERKRKRRSEQGFSEGELEELSREARLLKKFKAGKVVPCHIYLAFYHFFVVADYKRRNGSFTR